MIDALKRSSANWITAVIPYFGMRPAGTVKISCACRSQPNWWQTSLLTAGGPRVDDGSACQPDSGFFNIPVDNLYALPVLLSTSPNAKFRI